jgi:hypothetical protein
MQALTDVIATAQSELAKLLEKALVDGPLSVNQYQRYLSMQYHLTRGVQTYFLRAAAHDELARKRRLRKFLFDFANEEELHYLVAECDLRRMGLPVLPQPLDVTLWHAHFGAVVDRWPFLRLGAACVLENIAGGVAGPMVRKALQAPFLAPENSRFIVLHLHEAQPHGEQILEALASAGTGPAQQDDLATGARQAAVLFLRMMEWALLPSSTVALFEPGAGPAVAPGIPAQFGSGLRDDFVSTGGSRQIARGFDPGAAFWTAVGLPLPYRPR